MQDRWSTLKTHLQDVGGKGHSSEAVQAEGSRFSPWQLQVRWSLEPWRGIASEWQQQQARQVSGLTGCEAFAEVMLKSTINAKHLYISVICDYRGSGNNIQDKVCPMLQVMIKEGCKVCTREG